MSKLLPNGEDVPLPDLGDENVSPPLNNPVDAEITDLPNHDELEAARQALAADNVQMINALAQQGMDFDPPLLVIQLKMRVDMLTELLIPGTAPMRPMFELSYERQLNEMLQQATQNAARAKLLAK